VIEDRRLPLIRDSSCGYDHCWSADYWGARVEGTNGERRENALIRGAQLRGEPPAAPSVELSDPASVVTPYGRSFRSKFMSGYLLNDGSFNGYQFRRRVTRWTICEAARTGVSWMWIVLVISEVGRGASLWLLICLPFAVLTPVVIPRGIWIASNLAWFVVLPWPVRIAQIGTFVTVAVTCWYEFQWKRAQLGNPGFTVRAWRRSAVSAMRRAIAGEDA
jgi:hypothetical protein